MATGWRMLATEQECHDTPMQEVIREREQVRKRWMERGRSEGLWEFSLKGVRAASQLHCEDRNVQSRLVMFLKQLVKEAVHPKIKDKCLLCTELH